MTTRDMLTRIVLTLIPAALIYALVRLERGCCGHPDSQHACGIGCLAKDGDGVFCPCERCGSAWWSA
jgi:hypothetical protein